MMYLENKDGKYEQEIICDNFRFNIRTLIAKVVQMNDLIFCSEKLYHIYLYNDSNSCSFDIIIRMMQSIQSI